MSITREPPSVFCSIKYLLACILLYSIVFYCILLYSIVFYCILLYSIVFYCILLYSIVFYCILLYSIVFYCIVLNIFGVVRARKFDEAKTLTKLPKISSKLLLVELQQFIYSRESNH